MPDLRLALAQADTCVGDLVGNARLVLDAVAAAAAGGARLVALPEMTLAGYPVEDLALRAAFRDDAMAAVDALARDLADAGHGDVTVVVGTIGTTNTPDGPRPTNRAVALREGRVVATYDKRHLPTYGVFDEARIFEPGTTTTVLDVDGHRVGLLVCEDLWRADGPVAELADADLDLLLVLNGSPYEEGKDPERLGHARRAAATVGAPVAYVNQVGGQDDLVLEGGSFVLDVSGQVVARSPQFEPDLLVHDVPRRGGTLARGRVAPPLHPDEEVYRACVAGLAGYVRKNGFRSVVLGLSGGIDSALVAVMAADAIGGENVVGISMPSSYSSQHSKDDAADLARRIGADYRVQPIGGTVDAFERDLPLDGVAAENLQARVRGMILMSLSNAEGHLTLATGNKSELAVGYSTVYGDAVGGYAPLKDVLKSRVWALARWRDDHALDHGKIPPIPESSITKPPSAELRPGQVDQDSLPPYDRLDSVLEDYVGRNLGHDALLAAGHDPATIELVLRLVDRAEWKRRQYPPGPKVTAVAFGRDRRLPVTSRRREASAPIPTTTSKEQP
ncbi:NAD+ synthase [Sanguibacter sp. HDW7]|uniref:NAD+ synthase n=1 Tax=Sanguibacter sp. HDW7 TaxID=2714931 RepID=UPI00140D20E1|nr:NAD+ synthase [Sanguibacter sp. HDW7]QIK83735.1 NAD+ synthase [Sanguibacter sp. HDW7]